MEGKNEVKELRDSMDMNRREFSDYFEIPYRTVQDWEAEKRTMPPYVMRMMRYMAEMEKMIKSKPTISKEGMQNEDKEY